MLTKKETREEYDFFRYNQEAYYEKYGSNIFYNYAPKSDVLFVVFLILTLGSLLSWHLQQQQWQHVANRLIKAAVEDLPLRDGGTPESKELRTKALAIIQDKEKAANGDSEPTSKQKKKRGKLTPTEKREKLQSDLRPIVTELVNEITDFGAGYHQPTWKDLFVVRAAKFPVFLLNALLWNVKYTARRLQKIPLSQEEKEVLTLRAVGDVNWLAADEKEKARMLTLELWNADNMAKWEEAREFESLSMTERKRMRRDAKRKDDGYPTGDDSGAFKYD